MYFNDQTTVYLNGHFIPANQAQGTLYGQTLHYGYGVFEGIRSYATEQGAHIFKAREHYERLQYSAQVMHIPFPYQVDELIELSYKLLETNNLQDAYLRPILYTDPNMTLYKPTGVNIMIAAWAWGAYLGDKLLHLHTSSYQRPNPKSVHVAAKVCGHYVNSILATIEAKSNGFDEALLLDANGYIAEGPGSNIFVQIGNQLLTPQLGNILPGITRATVLQMCAANGISCTERPITLAELKAADSAFYCGTAAEIIGIASLDQYTFPLPWHNSIGSQLQTQYSQLVRQYTAH